MKKDMKEERLKYMEEYIKEKKICSLDTLCEVFGVSKVTVRRDVDCLCRKGFAEKVYGGVRYVEQEALETLPYAERDHRNVDEKEMIGKLAAGIISEGDTIFIDSGTTTLRLIRHVSDKKVTVFTNNLHVINACVDYPNIRLMVSGGEFLGLTKSFMGHGSIAFMDGYHIGKAFLAATGVSLDCGLTNSAPQETEIKKYMVEKSMESYVMIDHDKWDKVSLRTYGAPDAVTGFITDRKPPEKYGEFFRRHGVRVIHGRDGNESHGTAH